MASWNTAREYTDLTRSGVRRRSWPEFQYVQAHIITGPPPATIPSQREIIERWVPTDDDMMANDWEAA